MNVHEASSTAMSFANKLQMTAAINSFSLQKPEAGQLGCSGFIVLSPRDANILIRATPSFLQHGPRAHRVCPIALKNWKALPTLPVQDTSNVIYMIKYKVLLCKDTGSVTQDQRQSHLMALKRYINRQNAAFQPTPTE
eukprot:1159361-Pelagomonas_calceolata.AAC.4